MDLLRNSAMACALLASSGLASAAVICSGSTASPDMQAYSACATSLNANSAYRADLLVTPGSNGGNLWGLFVFDADAHSLLAPRPVEFWSGSDAKKLSLSFSSLGGNTIALVVGGSMWSDKLTTYSLTVTPVPEAPVWVMMLGGVSLIGLALRRRNSEHAELIAA